MSNDSRLGVYSTGKGKVVTFSLANGSVLAQYSGNVNAATVSISPNGEAIALGTTTKKVVLLKFSKSSIVLNGSIEADNDVRRVTFSNTGNYLGVCTGTTFNVFDAKSLKSIYSDKISSSTDIRFSPKDEYIAIGGDGTVTVYDLDERERYLTLLTDKGMDVNNYTVLDRSGRSGAWDKEKESKVNTVRFSSDGKQLITSNDDFTVQVWDWHRGKRSAIYRHHTQDAVFAAFSNYSSSIVSVSADMTIQLFDPTTASAISMMAHTNTRDWIAFSSDGYWDASQYGGDLIAYVQGSSCWNIDQFAITTNRPDLLLAKNPLADKHTVKHLYAQYLKRLRKFGLTEQTVSAENHTPQAEISKVNTTGNTASISFKLADSKYNIVSYNVFVNNVPIHAGKGKAITPIKTAQLTENLTLLSGENRVEVTCYNSKGVESIRALTTINATNDARPHIYYLGFGISEYKNSGYNLRYAAKDIRDMAEVVKEFEGKRFDKAYIQTFTNSEVTVDNILKSKEFLKNARPQDVLILHIAGHGMHECSSNADYYFLTYSSDTAKLAQTAAKFETIEAILDGIAPRKKLFLLDACESGEKDEDETSATGGFKQIAGVNYRGFINITQSPQGQAALKSVFQKDRFIYNDLTRRTGAIVFSSSKGGEPSAERSDHENGLFTEYIMQAFINNAADTNSDGRISVDELHDFVYRNVVTDTNNQQHPTIDRDNIYQRIEF
jgi:WD40 repeat protein/uncharacterized caspase-like protein